MTRTNPNNNEIRLSNDLLLEGVIKTQFNDGTKPYTLLDIVKGMNIGPGQVVNTGIYDFLGQSANREQFIIDTTGSTYGVLPYPGDFQVGSFFGIKSKASTLIVDTYYNIPNGILPDAVNISSLSTENIGEFAQGDTIIWITTGTSWEIAAKYSDQTPYTEYTTATLTTAPVAGSPVNLSINTSKYTIQNTHPLTSEIVLPAAAPTYLNSYPFYITHRSICIYNSTTSTYYVRNNRTDMLHLMPILPGQTLFWHCNNISIANSWTLSGENNPLKLITSVANSTTSLANVTGLGVSVVANRSYRFKYFITYTSAAVGTGSVRSLNFPAGTCHYTSEWSNTSTSDVNVSGQGANSVIGLSAGSATTTSNICIIEGVITPTANGTLIPRFASEIAGSTITALANFSYLDIKRL